MLVINCLREQTMSRADLAKTTGLTRAAISVIVDDLLVRGYIKELAHIGDKTLKPVHLAINAQSFFAAGVSLSREKCRVGIADLEGTVTAQEDVGLRDDMNVDACVDAICASLLRLTEGMNKETILGVGISAPGPIDTEHGRFLTPGRFECWHQVPLVEMMNKRLPWHSYMENAAVALTMTDRLYGAGKDFNSFVLLKVSSGVGGGIVNNKEILRGAGNYGNEIGHIVIQMNGEPCDCGNCGCLVAYASMPALLKRFERFGFSTWADVVDAAYAGDANAVLMVQTEAAYLSAAIISYINMLEPEAIVLAGAVAYKAQLLLALIRERVRSNVLMRGVRQTELLVSPILATDDVEVAATIIIEKYYRGEFGL